MITIKRINLQDRDERLNYSQKLQEFEKEFTYPLGDKSFYISHGKNSDYFVFFEKLGQPEILVLEDNNKLVGLVCLVLRVIDGRKTWYACDFKISKEYRGQKLYRKWMWKFFVPFYFKCQTLFGINMSSPEENKLWKHTQNIFKVFSVGVKPYYLYEFSAKNFSGPAKDLLLNHSLITNNGFKDIIVDGQSVSLYHLVLNGHIQKNLFHHKMVSVYSLNSDDSVMFLSSSKMDLPFAKETIISLIHRNNKNFYVSSAEI